MSVESALEKANARGFRIHQLYQRHAYGKPDRQSNWYFDVVLVHMYSVWDYFHGSNDDLEEAILQALKDGKAKLAYLESLGKKERLRELSPSLKLKEELEARKSKPPGRRRVRL